MDRTAVIYAAYWAVLAIGEEPSRRTVQAMTERISGKRLQTRDVLAVLNHIAEIVPEQFRRSTGSVPLVPRVAACSVPPEVQPSTRSRKRADLKGMSKLVPYVQPELVPLANANGHAAKAARPEWVENLHVAVLALQARDLPGLSPSERFLVARYHAVRFAYCSVVERTNKQNSRKAATSLSNLCEYLERRGIAVTVTTYFQAAEKFHKRIGGSPWYTPFDAKTEFVLEPAR